MYIPTLRVKSDIEQLLDEAKHGTAWIRLTLMRQRQALMTSLIRPSNHSDFLGVCPILYAKQLETLKQNTLLGAQ